MKANMNLHTGLTKRDQLGVSMVEFVIIAPIAFLLVLSIVQFGFIFMAKLNLNHATFMAARHGAVNNAEVGEIKGSVVKGLIPFYQNSNTTDPNSRILVGYGFAKVDSLIPGRLKVDRLNPPSQAFNDFGLTDEKGLTYIPNDNLEWRENTSGSSSRMSIQDANLLKIKVTYAYELKVPMMATMFKNVMCGGIAGGLQATGGNMRIWEARDPGNCVQFYMQNRIPLVSYATVHMQSPPYRTGKPS
jgi:Flp pilus assembly protein TadG